LCKSDDSCVEDFLGFSDVPPAQNLCENTGKDSVVLSNSYPTHDSNQFPVINKGTEKCEVNGNLSPSKSRNISLILLIHGIQQTAGSQGLPLKASLKANYSARIGF
jgi:hypothetical protein